MTETVKYSATRESGSDPVTYTLRMEFSDGPGVTIVYGCSPERCEAEMQACRDLGYAPHSIVFRSHPERLK